MFFLDQTPGLFRHDRGTFRVVKNLTDASGDFCVTVCYHNMLARQIQPFRGDPRTHDGRASGERLKNLVLRTAADLDRSADQPALMKIWTHAVHPPCDENSESVRSLIQVRFRLLSHNPNLRRRRNFPHQRHYPVNEPYSRKVIWSICKRTHE